MVRTILVPLDGSAFAEHALPLALAIARRMDAALRLVQVHDPVATLAGMEGAIVDPGWDAAARENERAYLDGAVERLRKLGAVPVTSALRDGPVAAAVDAEAAVHQAALVVMTSHGRGGLSRLWLGSVADQFIRRSTGTPILLLRPHEAAPDFQNDAAPRHFLIPLDGSALAEQILPPALALGRALGADFTLLRAIDPLLPAGLDAEGFLVCGLDAAALPGLRADAETYLERVAERLRKNGAVVRTRVVVNGRPELAILEAAAAPTDLTALATHGRGGMQRLLLGGVADKVLRGSSTPVLVLHPRGPTPDEEAPAASAAAWTTAGAAR